MGGGAQLLIPAPYTGMSTWSAHHRRVPPSTEPGTDYYMPIGTPLRSPVRGRVVAVGGGIKPATGRFVVIDDGVRWYRFLHLSEWHCRVGDELEPGEVFADSGASGYGSEFFGASHARDAAMIARTGGPHVHVTAFRGRAYTFGSTGTVDFHAMTGGKVAGNEDDVSAADVWNTTVKRASGPVKTIQELADAKSNTIEILDELAPVTRGGKKIPLRQEIADTKSAAIRIEAQIAALTAAVQSLATSSGADPKAIEAIVEKAVTDAMMKLSVTLDVDSTD